MYTCINVSVVYIYETAFVSFKPSEKHVFKRASIEFSMYDMQFFKINIKAFDEREKEKHVKDIVQKLTR